MSDMIIPRYNLVFTYDLLPNQEEDYYKFALSEFVPGMQALGLYLVRAWHTLYGQYPLRQSEFVAENLDTVRDALNNPSFADLEERMMDFVTNYDRHIVAFADGFQMISQN
jgi:hypothetical protein